MRLTCRTPRTPEKTKTSAHSLLLPLQQPTFSPLCTRAHSPDTACAAPSGFSATRSECPIIASSTPGCASRCVFASTEKLKLRSRSRQALSRGVGEEDGRASVERMTSVRPAAAGVLRRQRWPSVWAARLCRTWVGFDWGFQMSQGWSFENGVWNCTAEPECAVYLHRKLSRHYNQSPVAVPGTKIVSSSPSYY